MSPEQTKRFFSKNGALLVSSFTAASFVLSGGALLSQTLPSRNVVYTSAISAPPGTTSRDFEPPPLPIEIRNAVVSGLTGVGAALEAATAAVPEVPWDENGLAHVAIDPDDIRWDETRERYVVDLADGRTAILTLRRSMQSQLETVVSRYEEPGTAIVAIDPPTGQVLALVDRTTHADVGEHLAVEAYAYAASTFKVITGAALLGEGVATPETEVCFSGGGSSIALSQLSYNASTDTTCHSLREAMAHSSNVVFARLADQHLNPDVLGGYAEAFGYNSDIPFEIDVERSPAELPDDRLEFARSAAGFRHTHLSALHGAMIQAAIANDGMMMVPTIVESIEDAAGTEVWRHYPVQWRRALDADVNEQLVNTLSTTCTSGTARSQFAARDGFPADIQVYGKTGTLSNRTSDSDEPDPYYTFTWFIGFAVDAAQEVAVAGLAVNSPTWWVKGSFLASEAVLCGMR